MTTQHTTDPFPLREHRSVEDAWRALFEYHGVGEEQADLLVTMTFGTPRLSRASPGADEIVDIVDETLEDVQFEPHLDEAVDPSRVRSLLMEALELAVDGEMRGPASAPKEIARTPVADESSGAGADPALGARRARPLAFEEPSEQMEELVEALGTLLDKRDQYSVDDLKTAVNILEYRRDEEPDSEGSAEE